MTAALVQFLRDRLNEDEQTARRVPPNQAPTELRALISRAGGEPYLAIDSARVLREVEAKRQLLDASNVDCSSGCIRDHTFSGSCALRWMGPLNETDGELWARNEDGHKVPAPPVTAEWTLRLLATPYSEHPDHEQALAATQA